MGMTRQERIAIHKKQERLQVKAGIPDVEELKEGVMVLREQSGFESYHQKRSPKDSEISSLVPFWDRIRICDNEKYPAHFYIGNSKVILRYEVENDNS